MKIISWNSHFGFDELKHQYIAKYLADIYVIQECTEKDIGYLNKYYKNCIWYGDNIDSKYGIGILSNSFNIELLQEFNKDFRFVIPFKINNQNIEFTLFGIWTKDKDKNNKKIEYTEHTWRAINYEKYNKILSGNVILIGDFNSNNYWDKQYISKKVPTHNDIINNLLKHNIKSAYHTFFNCDNGEEKEPTLLWQMNKNTSFHIDYCFASENFLIKNVQVGSIEEWEINKLSDHCPLIVEYETI